MATTFHSEKVWTRIRQLLKHQKAGALVAVPFLAPNAAKQLPLRRGDVLVTRFDDAVCDKRVVVVIVAIRSSRADCCASLDNAKSNIAAGGWIYAASDFEVANDVIACAIPCHDTGQPNRCRRR